MASTSSAKPKTASQVASEQANKRRMDTLAQSRAAEEKAEAAAAAATGADVERARKAVLIAARTTLFEAIRWGELAEVERVLAAHPELRNTRKPDNKETPLMAAASAGKKDIVDALLTAGANVDLQDDDGTTAVMYAAQAGELEALSALLEAGADASRADNDDKTAVDYVIQYMNLPKAQPSRGYTMMSLLQAHGAPEVTPEQREEINAALNTRNQQGTNVLVAGRKSRVSRKSRSSRKGKSRKTRRIVSRR